MIVLIYVVVVVLILLTISYTTFVKSNFTNKEDITIDCVVARYNETVDWIRVPSFDKVTNFIIYNKGKPLNKVLQSNAKEIMLKNVGKCDHTFLHHIIHNYNDLADVTLFASGRADDPRKGPKILATMKLINKTHDSVFIGFRTPLPDSMYTFTIDDWLSTNPENHIEEGSITKTDPAKIRPFGKWVNHFWPGKKNNLFVFQSIFAVSKQLVWQHPIEYYQQLYEELNYGINPEAGHYMERAWGFVFDPIPSKCIYYQ